MSVVVLDNQSLLDLSIQYYGTIEAIFDLSDINNISITNLLEPGQTLQLPNKDFGRKEIANHYAREKIKPSTGYSNVLGRPPIIELEGIDYWAIGNDFIVE